MSHDLAEDEESYYSEEEVTCSENTDESFAELEKELMTSAGGPLPHLLASAMARESETRVAPKSATVSNARPPHPLFGGGGDAKSSLLEQIKQRGETPPTVQASSSNCSQAVSAPRPAPARTTAAPASRPPHPLFGGGDGGKSALMEQIKQRGVTQPAAHSSSSDNKPEAALVTKAVSAPPKPAPKPVAQMSMAEQVAMMAAKRQQRMQGGSGDESVEENTIQTPVRVVSSPASAPTPAPTPVTTLTRSPPPPPQFVPLTTAKKVDKKPEKKSGGFFGGGKKEDKKVVTDKKPVPKAAPTPVAQPVTVLKTYKPEPLLITEKPSAPIFSQSILKPTGAVRENAVAKLPESAERVERAPPATTTTTTTTTTTKTKRVIQSDPEYDVVEYKVGCFCTVL